MVEKDDNFDESEIAGNLKESQKKLSSLKKSAKDNGKKESKKPTIKKTPKPKRQTKIKDSALKDNFADKISAEAKKAEDSVNSFGSDINSLIEMLANKYREIHEIAQVIKEELAKKDNQQESINIPKPLKRKKTVKEKAKENFKLDKKPKAKRLSAVDKLFNESKEENPDLKSIPNNESHRLFTKYGLINKEEFTLFLNTTFDEFFAEHPDFFTKDYNIKNKEDEKSGGLLGTLASIFLGGVAASTVFPGLGSPMAMMKAAFAGIIKPFKWLINTVKAPFVLINNLFKSAKAIFGKALYATKWLFNTLKLFGKALLHPLATGANLLKAGKDMVTGAIKGIKTGASNGMKAVGSLLKTGAKKVAMAPVNAVKSVASGVGGVTASFIATDMALAAGELAIETKKAYDEGLDLRVAEERFNKDKDKNLAESYINLAKNFNPLKHPLDSFIALGDASYYTGKFIVGTMIHSLRTGVDVTEDVMDWYHEKTKDKTLAKKQEDINLSAISRGYMMMDGRGNYIWNMDEVNKLLNKNKKKAVDSEVKTLIKEDEEIKNNRAIPIAEKAEMLMLDNTPSINMYRRSTPDIVSNIEYQTLDRDNLRKTQNGWGIPEANNKRDVIKQITPKITLDDEVRFK